jgi:hypothetical protein
MSKSLKLYSTIAGFIWQAGVRMNDLRNVVTFIWAVTALIASGTVHLSVWSLYRKSQAKVSSIERQFSRWLHNEKLKVNEIYQNLATLAWVDWTGGALEVALDVTMLWAKYAVVRVAVIYRGRALPLAWVVVEQSSATVALHHYEAMLRQAARLLPSQCQVTLLADRGFDDTHLMELAVELNWHFVIRLKGSLWVYRPFKGRCKVSRLLPPQGEVHLLHTIQLTERRFGPVHLALGHIRTPNGYEQWALVSDLPTTLETFETYALRFDIEESFLDDKSGGFQLEASQIDDADALSRLLLILATATLYLVSTGTAIVAMGRRYMVDTHWHRGLSYFKIGWRWVTFALATGLKLLSFLWLVPGPDPEPVYASKAQAATPTLAFSAIRLIE